MNRRKALAFAAAAAASALPLASRAYFDPTYFEPEDSYLTMWPADYDAFQAEMQPTHGYAKEVILVSVFGPVNGFLTLETGYTCYVDGPAWQSALRTLTGWFHYYNGTPISLGARYSVGRRN
jgi:hypothetical protein